MNGWPHRRSMNGWICLIDSGSIIPLSCPKCHHPMYYVDVINIPSKIWKTKIWLMNLIHPMFWTSYDICIVLTRTLEIIHATPLLLVPFTEYPSSPSLCIYVGNKQEVGYAEMCVLYACYVGSEDVGNLEAFVFEHVGWEALSLRCDMYFVLHFLMYSSCKAM